MKVLHITGGLNRGGIENMIYNYISNMNSKKFTFHILMFNDSARDMEQQFKELGVKVFCLKPLREIGVFRYVLQLRKLMKKNRYDVVHAHTMQKAGLDLFAAFLAGTRKRVSHSHNTTHEFSSSKSLQLKMMGTLIKLFSNIKLACGEEAGNYLYKNSKFTVLRNSIDVSKFIYDTPRIKNKTTRILFVGRLVNQKNPLFITKLAKELLFSDVNFQITVVGKGELSNKLIEEIESLSLSRVVKCIGASSEVPKIMKESDIYIMPSIYEGLPLSMLEAQISGMLCLSSKNISEEVDLGLDNIRFLDINDTSTWIELIKKYNPQNIDKELIRNTVAKKGYSIHHNANSLERIYLDE